MKRKLDRVRKLSDTFAALLEQEKSACEQACASLIDSIRTIQGETADRRLMSLTSQLKSLQSRLGLLAEMGRRDFLAKIDREVDELIKSPADGRSAAAMLALMEACTTAETSSLNLVCETLLDRLIEATGAERGFILFYLPESTEADVVAARNFQTRNLSLEEYNFSRTLLREVLGRGSPLLLEDASSDPAYSQERSIINFQLKSVLAVPLNQRDRTVGAIYLENNSRPCAFDQEELRLTEALARFAVLYLDYVRLLPAVFEADNRIFFDADRASSEIVGRDPKIRSLLEVVARIADSPATVLIEGESGTGKELVARALHYQSSRRKRPFVAINCAAIPDHLLESELFGYEKGAFTGATERYAGRIEQGDGGTIFLDEVSELAYPLQAKLLRFLQSNEFTRLGGKHTITADVRVVAATSKDLRVMMEAGRFQEALYYRLSVIPVRLPSLSERTGDIPLLIDHFLEKFSSIYGKKLEIDGEATERLKRHRFPGNVRELENLIHRLAALAVDDVIRIGDLPQEVLQIRAQRVSLRRDSLNEILDTPPADLEDLRRRKREIRRALAEQEIALIERAIKEADGNLTEAANRLGVHRTTLHKLLRRAKGPRTKQTVA